MDIELYRSLSDSIDENYLQTKLKDMLAIKSANPFDAEPREGFREKEMGQYYMEMMDSQNCILKEIIYGLEIGIPPLNND